MTSAEIFRRGRARGALYVAEYRIRAMGKWLTSIFFVSFGNPLIYLLAIGVGVGALVDANTGGAGVNGVSYLQFLAPALLATAAIQAGLDETMFPTLEGFVWNKSFEGMHSTQLTSSQMVDGIMLAALVRALFTSGSYLVVLWFFGAITLESIPTLFLIANLAGMSFGAVMLASTSFIKDDDGYFAVIFRFVVNPMFLFSGTFYPLEQMPVFLQWIGWISPLWHSTNFSRAVSFGLEVPLWLMVVHISYLVMLLIVGLVIGKWQFERRLTK